MSISTLKVTLLNKKSAVLALFFSSFLFLVFNLYPYLNGVGCDYRFTMKSEHSTYQGKCKSGILTLSSKNDITGDVFYSRYIYGVDSHYMYYFLLGKDKYNASGFDKRDMDYLHAVSYRDDDSLYVARYKCLKEKGRCLLFFESEIENIHSLIYSGSLSSF